MKGIQIRDAAGLLAVLALMGLIAVAANGRPIPSLVQQGAADRLLILRDVGVLLAVGVAVAVAVAAGFHYAVVARRGSDVPLRATLLRATPLIVAGLVAFNLLVIAQTDLGAGNVTSSDDTAGPARPHSDRPGRPLEVPGWWAFQVRAGPGAPDREAGADIAQSERRMIPSMALAAIVLAALLAGWMVWRRYGRSAAVPMMDEDATERERRAMHRAVVATIDAMLADPDPRTAIIGAYARLLEHLAASGVGRREPEAPLEHLRRVLMALRVRPEPLRELVELFGLARFSTHRLDASHRERALDALGAVADDLADHGVADGLVVPGDDSMAAGQAAAGEVVS